MEIEKLVVGQLATNCYLVWDKKTKQTSIIDPGDAADFILQKIQDLNLKPKYILATHGHVDHVLAIVDLKIMLKIPFLMKKEDEFLLKRIKSSAKFWLGQQGSPNPKVDKYIKEGDKISLGKENLKVIETPGHSPGGVVFYKMGVLFSGDTLFKQGIGRYDFVYASEKELFKSIRKLLKLPENTKIYPGHGEETTIGDEKENFNL